MILWHSLRLELLTSLCLCASCFAVAKATLTVKSTIWIFISHCCLLPLFALHLHYSSRRYKKRMETPMNIFQFFSQIFCERLHIQGSFLAHNLYGGRSSINTCCSPGESSESWDSGKIFKLLMSLCNETILRTGAYSRISGTNVAF